jgi:hypothetical protein
VAASAAQAQRFGASGSWGSDSDIGLGGRVEFDLSNKLSKSGPLSKAFFIGQADYYFDCGGGVCTWLDINPGLAVPIGSGKMDTYLGAGLNMARVTVDLGSFGSASDSKTGLNLIGGIRFPLSGMSTFTEARFSLGGGEQIAVSFGVLFGKSASAK